MTNRTIAILTPSKSSYSETFIKNHIDFLPFKKVVVYGGYFPWKCDEVKSSNSEAFWNLYDIFTRKRGLKASTYRKRRLAHILKSQGVECVLAEFIITGSYVWELCQELKIPLIATGLGYEVSVRSLLEKHRKDYQGYLNYSSASILVAENMKKVLTEMGGDPAKMIWSPAGPAEEFFKLKRKSIPKHLLLIGRFAEKKAPHLSILAFAQAVKQHPDARLKMAGDGELLRVCKDLSKALGIEDKVDFIGRITQDEQRDLLCNCRAFVQHSRTAEDGDKEGTPVAIVEASAAAVPIISTKHSGIPDVVVHGETGLLCDEGDVSAMAEHMSTLLTDELMAREMGEKGRKLARKKFSLELHIDTITLAINKAIEGR